MKVVEVIPVVKGLLKESLAYFSKDKLSPGSLVKVPIRSGTTLAIVKETKDVKQAKTSLRQADFSLKKISSLKENSGLSESFIKAALDTARFYATTHGSVLSAVLPKIFLTHLELINKPKKDSHNKYKEIKVVQLTTDERYREYRGIVRESFARSRSVIFVVPTKEDAIRAEEELSVGIEKYVFQSVGLSDKKLVKKLLEAKSDKHPVVLITTPKLIAFDRNDLGTIIVERENSRAYKTRQRPYIDLKTFIKNYAKARGLLLVLGDSVLSLESLWREREGEYAESTPLTWRLKQDSLSEIVDMRAKKEFEILSEKLSQKIYQNLKENKKVFLFSVRKGVASSTVCEDCASLLLCQNCASPLTLHKRGEEDYIYKCHHCSAKRPSETRCDTCSSWKLKPLGIGIDRLVEECEEKFPGVEVYVVDKDHTTTSSRAKSVIKQFLSSRQSILIGTEMALPLLKKIDLVAVPSLDPLFSIPDFHINERIFYLITRLREITKEHFILQTRNAHEKILEEAAAGNVLDFYREEIKEREDLRYPPFTLFIKIEVSGTREELNRRAIDLQNIFSLNAPHFTIERNKADGEHLLSTIIRLEREEWPNQEMLKKLLLLTPEFSIKVDPDSII